jgi:hypothetical protein
MLCCCTYHTAMQADLDLRVHSMGDRALELGQVLGAVANILDRCEKGSTIKRTSLISSSGAAGSSSGAGTGAGAAAGELSRVQR